MKRRHARFHGDGLMQSGDVAESDDRPWVAGDGVVVDPVEDAHYAVAAARKKETVELIRPKESVEVFEPLVVVARQIGALALASDVGRQRHAHAPRFERALPLSAST